MAYRDKGIPKPLTPKQEAFAQAFFLSGNATAAYRQAYDVSGMQDPSIHVAAHALVHNPKLVLRLDELRKETETRTTTTQAWVLSRLRENVERALRAVPVLDQEGQPTGEYRYEGAVANRALELIGKHLGMFTDRVQVEGLLHHTGAVGQLSDADLRRLLDALPPAPTTVDVKALPPGHVATDTAIPTPDVPLPIPDDG